jgi:hypothetical protein
MLVAGISQKRVNIAALLAKIVTANHTETAWRRSAWSTTAAAGCVMEQCCIDGTIVTTLPKKVSPARRQTRPKSTDVLDDDRRAWKQTVSTLTSTRWLAIMARW